MSAKSLNSDKCWWHGPEWLSEKCENWPRWNLQPFTPSMEHEYDSELVKTKLIQFQATECQQFSATSPYGDGLKIENFSNLSKLLRVGALTEKAVGIMRRKNTNVVISHADTNKALIKWVILIQSTAYSEELELLKSNKENKLIRQLGLKLSDDGVIRSFGRLANSDLSCESKMPILIPKDHQLTSLIIRDVHERNNLHPGMSQVLAKVREKFWIPSGRKAVASVLKECRICRKHSGGAFKPPKMPPWPVDRVTRHVPFVQCGVDYFGPILTRADDGKRKVWICLFTCLVTRAIHLEVVENMTTDSFIQAFRRFVARYGTPETMYSDNAKQFKLAHELLRHCKGPEFNETINSYMSTENITWKFIPEKSPWFGGFYERLVAIVKTPLRKVIGRGFPSLFELQTIVAEVQALVNTRPLVYIDGDRNSSRPICPSDFLSMSHCVSIPVMNEDDDDIAFESNSRFEETYKRIWQEGQRILDEFWNLWREEYLKSLRERHQCELKRSKYSEISPTIGTVVIIKDDHLRRSQWKLGRISNLIKSRDGEIRTAEVRLSNGTCTRRAISLLFPLESMSIEKEIDDDHESNNLQEETRIRGPSRAAKREATNKIVKLYQTDNVTQASSSSD